MSGNGSQAIRHLEKGEHMEQTYLITGINGFLGRTVAQMLLNEGKEVIGLRVPGDKKRLIDHVTYYLGDVSQKSTLTSFFEAARGKEAVVLHCAGIVSIASEESKIWSVNVDGTRNIVDLCEQYSIAKLIYVSSVHAIAERRNGKKICETRNFSASRVEGAYGKSKAEATAYVQKAADRGLPAVIVHPSGIIGPGDYNGGYLTELIHIYAKHNILLGVKGGYDFVDVRDVADGILKCVKFGKSGEAYILSNQYITVSYLLDTLARITGRRKLIGSVSVKWVKLLIPICKLAAKITGNPALVTPYSLYTLTSNGRFSHKKADKELGYTVRAIEETLADVVCWMEE